jgi:hypothetical protein
MDRRREIKGVEKWKGRTWYFKSVIHTWKRSDSSKDHGTTRPAQLHP